MKVPTSGKIFQIGTHKCGTTSLYDFFKENGITSVHWDDGKLAKKMYENHKSGQPLMTGYDKYTFYSDMQCGMQGEIDGNFYGYYLFKELDQQYPNSKFILNIRDVNKYLNSKINHNFGNGSTLDHAQKMTGLKKKNIVRLWLEEYYQHYLDVLMYFKDRPQDLLLFDIEKDGVDKIINFFPELRLKRNLFKVKNKNNAKVFTYDTFTVKSKMMKKGIYGKTAADKILKRINISTTNKDFS